MGAYRVQFFKTVTNSYGKSFQVCQRTIDIRRARTPDRAVEAAKWHFERREQVPQWFLHADYIVVDAISVSAHHALT
jgi:hypothetical protein